MVSLFQQEHQSWREKGVRVKWRQDGCRVEGLLKGLGMGASPHCGNH